MKKLILFLILLCSFITYGQVKPTKDTSNISIPYNMAQQMLLDLNEYDKLKELSFIENGQEITTGIKLVGQGDEEGRSADSETQEQDD